MLQPFPLEYLHYQQKEEELRKLLESQQEDMEGRKEEESLPLSREECQGQGIYNYMRTYICVFAYVILAYDYDINLSSIKHRSYLLYLFIVIT